MDGKRQRNVKLVKVSMSNWKIKCSVWFVPMDSGGGGSGGMASEKKNYGKKGSTDEPLGISNG